MFFFLNLFPAWLALSFLTLCLLPLFKRFKTANFLERLLRAGAGGALITAAIAAVFATYIAYYNIAAARPADVPAVILICAFCLAFVLAICGAVTFVALKLFNRPVN